MGIYVGLTLDYCGQAEIDLDNSLHKAGSVPGIDNLGALTADEY